MADTKIISVIQMKGGVGKTNCAVNLAAVLAKNFDQRVLLADFDPQTNATLSVMHEKDWLKWDRAHGTMAEVLGMEKEKKGEKVSQNLKDYIVKGVCERIPTLDLLPSHLKMTFIDTILASQPGRERIFSRKLKKIKDQYDVIVCDCPPSLMSVTQNALCASNYFLIPMQPDYLSTVGLKLVLDRVSYLKKSLQISVRCLGVVFTRVRGYLNYHAITMEEVKNQSPFKKLHFFNTFIPENITLSEAPMQNLPINVYDSSAPGAYAFRALGAEVAGRLSLV